MAATETSLPQQSSVTYFASRLHGHIKDLATLHTPTSLQAINANFWAAISHRHFEKSGDLADLDKSISLYRKHLRLGAESVIDRVTDRPDWLNDLGCSLVMCFELLGEMTDLDEAISIYRECVQITSQIYPAHPTGLSELVFFLPSDYPGLEPMFNLDHSISHHSGNHPDRPRWLCTLAEALGLRFRQLGNIRDLCEAIFLHREAVRVVPHGHPLRPRCLSNLGVSLGTRFGQFGGRTDLDEAISLHRESVQLTPYGHSHRPKCLMKLALNLNTRFEQLGEITDLDEAIYLSREAISIISYGDPFHPRLLSSLGVSLDAHFWQFGERNDLDEAISLHQKSIQLTPRGHLERPVYLAHLAHSLITCFMQHGEMSDLNEAISLLREAVQLIPQGHSYRPALLNGFATSLALHFQHLEEKTELDEAICVLREAVQLTQQGHSARPGSLSRLALALNERSMQFGERTDLDEAISLHQESIQLTPQNHSLRHERLGSLAVSLTSQFEQFGNTMDLDKAIHLGQECLQLAHQGYSSRPFWLNNLAFSLQRRFEQQSEPPTHNDLHHAFDAWSEAIEATPAHALDRFDIAIRWAHAAIKHKYYESALQAYTAAISLLTRIASIGLDIQSRQKHLRKRSSGLACDAAACALQVGQVGKAVELLEAGRSILWQQSLQLRTSLASLHKTKPKLAERLHFVGQALEQGTLRVVSHTSSMIWSDQLDLENSSKQFRQFEKEWEKLVEEARKIPGFHNFLKPVPFTHLCEASGSGVIIVLNTSQLHCDALILSSNLVKLIPLPELCLEDAKELAHTMVKITRGFGSTIDESQFEETLQEVLKDLWDSIVSHIEVGLQDLPADSRIWWLPTGPLSFLPLHATALKYGMKQVSSYALTLSSLLHAQELSFNKPAPFRMLAVDQELKHSGIEIQKLQLHCLQSKLPCKVLAVKQGEPEMFSKILASQKFTWLHMSCHGVQSDDKPLESYFRLHQSKLYLADILHLNLPHAVFASLAACHTAAGAKDMPDEAMHLAAGLQFAGFQGLLATMWAVNDSDAPNFVDTFYGHLFTRQTGESPIPQDAAAALHKAIKQLRKTKVPLHRWVPFIHIGI